MSAGRLMTNLSPLPPAREQILAALEAESAALRALEVVATVSNKQESAESDGREHLDRAIDLLRQSIRELRLAEGDESRVGATGFVLAVRQQRQQRKPSGEPPPAAET